MIVVDCAAVIDALTADDGIEALSAALSVNELHAPSLLDYEVVSTLRSKIFRGELSAIRAADALTDFEDLRIERWPAADALRRRALQLRENVSAYDAAYIALAEALGCPLLTRDVRLSRTTGHDAAIEVR